MIKHRNKVVVCSVSDCDKLYHCRGYCRSHYNLSYKGKLPQGKSWTDNLKMRYDRKIDKTESCWLWTGAMHKAGYGRIRIDDGRIKGAHVVMYELYKGKIPEGLELDHLCCVRSCVNPEHLEPVTHEVNMNRSGGRKTNCPQGHEFDTTNTYINPLGRKICRKCTNIAGRKYRKKKMEYKV